MPSKEVSSQILRKASAKLQDSPEPAFEPLGDRQSQDSLGLPNVAPLPLAVAHCPASVFRD